MALAITPMTTAALGSVEGEHSGMASGVNNAVTRVAGLLAVASSGRIHLRGVLHEPRCPHGKDEYA